MFSKAVLDDSGTIRSVMAFFLLHLKWGLFQQFEKHWMGGGGDLQPPPGPKFWVSGATEPSPLLSELLSLLNLTLSPPDIRLRALFPLVLTPESFVALSS